MTGISMHELKDALKANHEIEFLYDGSNYIIQPESRQDSDYLTIWVIDVTPSCIAEVAIGHDPADDNSIQMLLSQPCFAGASFNEISKDVVVSIIF